MPEINKSVKSSKPLFEAPIDELTMIYPQPRIKLFENLVANLKVFLPDLSCIYAGLNFDSSIMSDYLLIFEAETAEGRGVVLYITPILYSALTVPGYRYACKTKRHKDFFMELRRNLCQMEAYKFKEFIESNLCELSMNPKDSRYWMDSKNGQTLINAFTDMSAVFSPRGFTSTGGIANESVEHRAFITQQELAEIEHRRMSIGYSTEPPEE